MAETKFESKFQSFIADMKKNIKENSEPASVVKMVTYLSHGLNFLHKYKCVENANASAQTLDMLVNAMTLPDCVQKCRQYIQELTDVVLKEQCIEICRPLFTDETIKQSIKDQIAKQLVNGKVHFACKIIENGAYISLGIFAVQCLNLYFTWREISQADNVMKESREKFPEVIEKIEILQKETAMLTDLMKQFEATDDKRNRVQIALKVSHLTNSLNCIYIDVKELISDIKVKINGKIERIDLSARKCKVDGVSNVLQGAINLFQYWQLGNVAGTTHKLIQGAVTFTYFALAAGNAITYRISKKVLDRLRDAMEMIKEFERQLKLIRQEIQQAEKWYAERQREAADYFNFCIII